MNFNELWNLLYQHGASAKKEEGTRRFWNTLTPQQQSCAFTTINNRLKEGKFVQWIMRIAHNLIIDYFRKEQKIKCIRSNDEVNVFDVIGNFEDSIETVIIKKQISRDVRRLIKLLPEEQRRVLIMRHYADMSFKEIAEKTGVSINTALGRMRYALLNMRKMAEEKSMLLTV